MKPFVMVPIDHSIDDDPETIRLRNQKAIQIPSTKKKPPLIFRVEKVNGIHNIRSENAFKIRQRNAKRTARFNRRRHKVVDIGAKRPPHLTQPYIQYMQSVEWANKRREALAVHGKKCQRCGSRKKIQCHHKTYVRLFHEDIRTDLEILCKTCHEKEHNRKF
jgi:5-methylcytosine-specific restriction endonuclease McrA